jgi:hypothetical protein
MDEYIDDSDVIVICKAVLAMVSYFSIRTMRTLIDIELEAEGFRLPLTPMFPLGRP